MFEWNLSKNRKKMILKDWYKTAKFIYTYIYTYRFYMCVLYRSIPLLDFCGSRAFVLTRRCRFPRRPVGLAASPSSSAVQGPTASAFRALEWFRLFFPKFCFFYVFLSNILTLFILILKKDMCTVYRSCEVLLQVVLGWTLLMGDVLSLFCTNFLGKPDIRTFFKSFSRKKSDRFTLESQSWCWRLRFEVLALLFVRKILNHRPAHFVIGPMSLFAIIRWS